MRNIDRREREVSNEGMKLLLESSENTAFQATFWGWRGRFFVTINGSNYSLGREFLRARQAVILVVNKDNVAALPTLRKYYPYMQKKRSG